MNVLIACEESQTVCKAFRFKPDGYTVHDYDARFLAEEQGLVPTDKRFRWRKLKDIEPNKEDKNL